MRGNKNIFLIGIIIFLILLSFNRPIDALSNPKIIQLNNKPDNLINKFPSNFEEIKLDDKNKLQSNAINKGYVCPLIKISKNGTFVDKPNNGDWYYTAKKSNGKPCKSDKQCISGYCDNDGVGLTDDNWCFTPYKKFFDGQEKTKCEISTGRGDYRCDEIIAGTKNCDANWFYKSLNINDSYFSIKNSTGSIVAWFDKRGNLNLKGTCFVSANCIAPEDSFIIQNSNHQTVSYISPEGNLCIESGKCSGSSKKCNPATNAFLVQKNKINISYIDFNGKLCLTGKLNKNVFK